MLGHVLVPIDGSELSERALDYAKELVGPEGRLTLLTVVDFPDLSTYSIYPAPLTFQHAQYEEVVNNAEKTAVDYVRGAAERLRTGDQMVHTVVAVGSAAHSIIEQARLLEVDAIVMATHGRSGVNQWIFGSVTQKVLSAMPCPVFVVPGRVILEHANESPSAEATGD